MGFGQRFARNMSKRCTQYAIRSMYDLWPTQPKKTKQPSPSYNYSWDSPKEEKKTKKKKKTAGRAMANANWEEQSLIDWDMTRKLKIKKRWIIVERKTEIIVDCLYDNRVEADKLIEVWGSEYYLDELGETEDLFGSEN